MSIPERVLLMTAVENQDHAEALIDILKTEVMALQTNDVWRDGAGGRYGEETYALYAKAMLHVTELAFGQLPFMREMGGEG